MWAITKNEIGTSLNKVTSKGDDYDYIIHHLNGRRFRLLDGDGKVYFCGIYVASGDDEFAPLDNFGRDYGCTRIEYKGDLGWEQL